jgi:regulatory protein
MTSKLESKRLTLAEAFSKICRYCAYQERSHREVKNKLFEYGLYSSEADELLSKLITENFLNEERYARAFSGGKFRMMKWGKVKIQKELEQEGLTPRCIARGLSEIDTKDYVKTLTTLINKKFAQLDEPNLYKKKNKVARYVTGKGYESELVWDVLKDFK